MRKNLTYVVLIFVLLGFLGRKDYPLAAADRALEKHFNFPHPSDWNLPSKTVTPVERFETKTWVSSMEPRLTELQRQVQVVKQGNAVTGQAGTNSAKPKQVPSRTKTNREIFDDIRAFWVRMDVVHDKIQDGPVEKWRLPVPHLELDQVSLEQENPSQETDIQHLFETAQREATRRIWKHHRDLIDTRMARLSQQVRTKYHEAWKQLEHASLEDITILRLEFPLMEGSTAQLKYLENAVGRIGR